MLVCRQKARIYIMPNDLIKTQSINNVNITPIMKEVIEYSKDQASVGD